MLSLFCRERLPNRTSKMSRNEIVKNERPAGFLAAGKPFIIVHKESDKICNTAENRRWCKNREKCLNGERDEMREKIAQFRILDLNF